MKRRTLALLSLTGLAACRSLPGGADAARSARERLGQLASADRAPTPAAPEGLLGEEEAVLRALDGAPAARESLAELGLERAAALSWQRIENPSAHAELRFSSEPIAVEATLVQSLSAIAYGLARRDAAYQEALGAKEAAVERLLALARTARQAHLGYRAELTRQGLLEEAAKKAEARAVIAEELYRSGNINALARDAERATAETLMLGASDGQARCAARRAALASLIGAPIAGDWRVSAVLDPPEKEAPIEGLLAKALESSAALAAANARRQAASSKAEVARWQGAIPELGAGVTVHHEHGEAAVGPVLALRLPVFDQGQAEIAAAEAMAEKYQAQEEGARRMVEEQAHRAEANWRAARARLSRLADTLVPLRAQIAEETEAQLNAMNATLFQVLDARQRELETKLSWVDAAEAYHLATLDIRHLIAGGSLEPAHGSAPPRPTLEAPSSGGGH